MQQEEPNGYFFMAFSPPIYKPNTISVTFGVVILFLDFPITFGPQSEGQKTKNLGPSYLSLKIVRTYGNE